MTLLKQKEIILINKCGAIYDKLDLAEAILWYSNSNDYIHDNPELLKGGKE